MAGTERTGKQEEPLTEEGGGRSPEEMYGEREKRIRDAILLKVPDRVPVCLAMGYFPARYTGVSCATAYYDSAGWREANKKTIVDLEPDMYSISLASPGLALEALEPNLYKWPGDGLGPDVMHQYIEGEPLKAEEYDLFLSDPGDFTLRYYLPRVWGALKAFSKLPPLTSLWGAATLASRAAPFGMPEVLEAFETLSKAGREAEACRKVNLGFHEEMAALGFPAISHGRASAPFDVISDHLRGMRGAMLDMYRCPDKLIAACDLILSRSMKSVSATLESKVGNPKRVGSALHRGSDGFMSLEQFEIFYWPTLKKLIVGATELGLVHVPFYEGDWARRLEYLLELPKGKTLARFAMTDLARAKAVLGGHTCIMGNVPHRLMQSGSPQEVTEYCRNLIKVAGQGGGLILTTSTGLTAEAKPENVKAMIDAAKTYGRY